MKKNILLIITSLFFLGCSNDGNSNQNPYIPNNNFSVDINMNLPLYSTLKSPGNGIYYSDPRIARGIIIFNAGNSYNAFDAACPNHELKDCSIMTLKGINALCDCDKFEYNLFTGDGGKAYPMKQYRTQLNGDFLKIYN